MSAEVIPFPGAPDELVLLKPGDYTAVYVRHQGVQIFRCLKLQVLLRLLEHPELVLSRWYRVSQYKGRISAAHSSDLVREVSAALGIRIRRDRIPVASLANLILRVTVKTVEVDRSQHPLHPVNRYSVIARVEGKA